MTETDAALLAKIEATVRALHYYGNPPDSRLQGRVDADVADVLDDVRALVERQAARIALYEKLEIAVGKFIVASDWFYFIHPYFNVSLPEAFELRRAAAALREDT